MFLSPSEILFHLACCLDVKLVHVFPSLFRLESFRLRIKYFSKLECYSHMLHLHILLYVSATGFTFTVYVYCCLSRITSDGTRVTFRAIVVVVTILKLSILTSLEPTKSLNLSLSSNDYGWQCSDSLSQGYV